MSSVERDDTLARQAPLEDIGENIDATTNSDETQVVLYEPDALADGEQAWIKADIDAVYALGWLT